MAVFAFVQLADDYFQGGDKVYAQLDIWKTNALWGQVNKNESILIQTFQIRI